MKDPIQSIVRLLDMRPHPEGGFYKEVYRAGLVLNGLPHGAPRNAATGIYYLLPPGAFSAFHRVCSDELWHHYGGDPVALHIFDKGGAYNRILLGCNLVAGERPQAVVPAHVWQAAEPTGDAWALCGCTVIPGFDFADFEMAERTDLLERYPEYAAIIRRLTRE